MMDLHAINTLNKPFVPCWAVRHTVHIKSGQEPSREFIQARYAERQRVNGRPAH
jgi:hypothetical protein